MKTCPNCGSLCDDGIRFCGECGFSFANAPVPPQAQPAQWQQYPPQSSNTQQTGQPYYSQPNPSADERKASGGKKKLPLFIGLGAAAVVLIVVLALLISRLFGGRGSGDFIGSQAAYLEERARSWTEQITKDSVSSDITVSVDINGRSELADILSEILDDSSIVIKLDSKPEEMLLNAAFYLRGSNILEGFLRLTPDEIGFSVPNADDTYYVAELSRLMETLGLESDDTQVNVSAAEIKKDLESIFERYRSLLSRQIGKNQIRVEKNREVKLREVSRAVKCTVMTWEPDGDTLADLIGAVADMLEDDEQLANLLDLFSVASYRYDSGMDMLADTADDLRDNAYDYAEELVDLGFTWTVALNARSEIALISITTDEGGIVFERFIDDRLGAEAFYVYSGRSTLAMITNDFSVNGKKHDGTLVADTSKGGIRVDYDIDLSKKSVFGIPYGYYRPDLRNIIPGLSLELSVTDGEKGSTDHVLSVNGLDNLTRDRMNSVELYINTTGKSSAKEPAGIKKDISDYDMYDLDDLFYDIIYDIGMSLIDSPEIGELLELLYGF